MNYTGKANGCMQENWKIQFIYYHYLNSYWTFVNTTLPFNYTVIFLCYFIVTDVAIISISAECTFLSCGIFSVTKSRMYCCKTNAEVKCFLRTKKYIWILQLLFQLNCSRQIFLANNNNKFPVLNVNSILVQSEIN